MSYSPRKLWTKLPARPILWASWKIWKERKKNPYLPNFNISWTRKQMYFLLVGLEKRIACSRMLGTTTCHPDSRLVSRSGSRQLRIVVIRLQISINNYHYYQNWLTWSFVFLFYLMQYIGWPTHPLSAQFPRLEPRSCHMPGCSLLWSEVVENPLLLDLQISYHITLH